jgi:hypothetical protein
VKRLALLAAILLLGTTRASPPIALTIAVQRTSFDLLDSVAIELVAHNPGSTPRTVRYAQPSEYVIDVLSGNTVIWSTQSQTPQPEPSVGVHQRVLPPGPTPIVIYAWNTIERDMKSPQPGTYTIRARLLADVQPVATAKITFIAPLPTTALAALKPSDVVTLGGTLDAGKGILSDSAGSAILMRRIIDAPSDVPVVVRGTVAISQDGSRRFVVYRWAPLSN